MHLSCETNITWLVDLLHIHFELLEIQREGPHEQNGRDYCCVLHQYFVLDVHVTWVDESAEADTSEVGVGEESLEDPGFLAGEGEAIASVLPEVAHDDEDGDGDAHRSHEGRSLCELIVDSLAVDAGHKEAVGCQSNRAENCNLLGVLGDRHAVDPPLDEQKLQEVDEERVHHAHSEDDGVRILQGWLEDGGMFYLGRCPLDRLIGTQMAKAPRVRMVAVQIMPGTLIAPMLSLMFYYKKSSKLSSNHALNYGIIYWMEGKEQSPCPRCEGSSAVVRIVYGVAGMKQCNEAAEGKIHLGGCVVDSSKWHYCKSCKLEFKWFVLVIKKALISHQIKFFKTYIFFEWKESSSQRAQNARRNQPSWELFTASQRNRWLTTPKKEKCTWEDAWWIASGIIARPANSPSNDHPSLMKYSDSRWVRFVVWIGSDLTLNCI